MAKTTATTGDADFSEVANMGLTPEAQEAFDKALGVETAPAPVTVASPTPVTSSVPITGKAEKINGLTVTSF